jgi:hypothetical protein
VLRSGASEQRPRVARPGEQSGPGVRRVPRHRVEVAEEERWEVRPCPSARRPAAPPDAAPIAFRTRCRSDRDRSDVPSRTLDACPCSQTRSTTSGGDFADPPFHSPSVSGSGENYSAGLREGPGLPAGFRQKDRRYGAAERPREAGGQLGAAAATFTEDPAEHVGGNLGGLHPPQVSVHLQH